MGRVIQVYTCITDNGRTDVISGSSAYRNNNTQLHVSVIRYDTTTRCYSNVRSKAEKPTKSALSA